MPATIGVSGPAIRQPRCGRYRDTYSRHYRGFDVGAELDTVDGLADGVDRAFEWVRELTPEEFVGMALSSTEISRVAENIGAEVTRRRLHELIGSHFPEGRVRVPYVTRLFLRSRV